MTKHHWLVDRLATPVKKPAISIKLVQQLARLDKFYCKWLSIIILTVFIRFSSRNPTMPHPISRQPVLMCWKLTRGQLVKNLTSPRSRFLRKRKTISASINGTVPNWCMCSLWMNMWQCTIFLVFFGKLLQTSALIFAYSRTKRAPSRIKKKPTKVSFQNVWRKHVFACVRGHAKSLKKCIILDIMVDLWCNVVIMIDSWASSSRITFTLLA